MRTRLLASCGLLLGVLTFTTGPAAALSCVAPPPDVAEVTITGDAPDEGWYGDTEVPVVIGRVVEGTESQPEAPGDRLALVEVIGGLRLQAVPAEVPIVADDLIGWGHPSYLVGEHVFLRIDEWNVVDGDLAGGIADGPCSWNRRYTPAEIESLLTLADEHEVPFVTPTPIVDEDDAAATSTTAPSTTAPSTTAPSTTASSTTTDPGNGSVDDAEPIATSEEGDEGDDEGASIAVVIGAIIGVGLLAAGAFIASSRR